MKRFAAALSLCLLLSGCGSPEDTPAATTLPAVTVDSQQFSQRDFETEAGEKAVSVKLEGDTAVCGSDAVQIQGSTVTVTDEGTYVFSGTLHDGAIIVDTPKDLKTQLILNGVTIHSSTGAAIYVRQSDKVFITLEKGSENTLSNGGSFTAIDENNIDAVIFSKEDLTLNGSGSLTVRSPAGHGIVSKDSLTVTGGSYTLEAGSHGLSGKDSVCIAGGDFSVTSGKDGIHAEHGEDATLGYVYLSGGSYTLRSEGDGISGETALKIDGGNYDIRSGGGSENAQPHSSQGFGGFGGGPGGMGGPGKRPRSTAMLGTSAAETASGKGLKAGTDLTVNGGSFTLDCADDALHSNGSISVNGGSFAVLTGDDGFHADENLTVTAGSVSITESYEGLEGLHIAISGGDIRLISSDDGINAAGGTDSSGFGGWGGDQFGGFGMGGAGNGSILISGGTLYINASGDGIDANGTLEITGGHTTVCGPTRGDTATLDYDSSATISGGTFIGTGASGMAQTFSESAQGVFAVSVGSQKAGTKITLCDAKGNEILSAQPELDFAVVILSSPAIRKGEAYTVTVGETSATFEAY